MTAAPTREASKVQPIAATTAANPTAEPDPNVQALREQIHREQETKTDA